MKTNRFSPLLILALLWPTAALRAWDYEGHKIVNQLALASLPADFPAFAQEPTAAARIVFLAGEPDRWRNTTDQPIANYNGVDHYLDLEELEYAGLDARKLPAQRYQFAVLFAQGRAAHPDKFPPIDQSKNADHAREWVGFAPWAISEYYGKLKSAFSYLKTFQEPGPQANGKLGTDDEIRNAQDNVIYIMGVMGHYVGDCAQPLHATVHHHGWVGANPNHYTTWSGFHAWIDGGLIAKAGIKSAAILPRVTETTPISVTPQPDGRDPMFVAVMNYVIRTQELVEPLYQLEKAGKLGYESGKNNPADPNSPAVSGEGSGFVQDQLLRGGEMLGSIWLTAWRNAPPDKFLHGVLVQRPPLAVVVPIVPPPAPAAATEYWASSKSSKHLYHLPTCEWAQKIKAENKVVFASKAEAEAQGYKPCGTCKP